MDKITSKLTEWLGSHWAIIFAILLVVLWALCGPLFQFSDIWQLTINTTTTIVTFIMVFIIQNTTNRESRATQVKLDAILEALDLAPNELVGLEEETEKRIKEQQGIVRNSK